MPPFLRLHIVELVRRKLAMRNFLIRTLLTALIFMFVLPLIPGIKFHGHLGVAIVCALLFGLLGFLVDLFAKFLSLMLTISTLGLALLILIPLWVFGFWLLPAVTLHVLSEFMPGHFAVNGWIPAIEGGLVLMVVGILTGGSPKKLVK